jgi:hypothetical protein
VLDCFFFRLEAFRVFLLLACAYSFEDDEPRLGGRTTLVWSKQHAKQLKREAQAIQQCLLFPFMLRASDYGVTTLALNPIEWRTSLF